MKNQNNNRKKTHTTYSITNTHTHINIDKYTQKTEMNGTICFLKQFFVSKPGWNLHFTTGFPRSLDSSKTTPKCPKTRTNLPFTPGFSQKGAWTAPKPPPTKKKKKIPKKKKEFPKQFRTHFLFVSFRWFLQCFCFPSSCYLRFSITWFYPVPRCTQPRRVAAMSVGRLRNPVERKIGKQYTVYGYADIRKKREKNKQP